LGGFKMTNGMNNVGKKRTKAFFCLVFLLTFVLLPGIPAVYAGTADCVFGLSSTTNTQLSIGSNVGVGISITLPTTAKPFTPGITAVGLEVSYDPKVMSYVDSSGKAGTATGIVSTDFEVPTVLKNGDKPTGKIIITYSTAGKGIIGNGNFFNLRFKVLKKSVGVSTIKLELRTSPPGRPVDYALNDVAAAFTPSSLKLSFLASDVIPPVAPKVNAVSIKSKTVKGKTEAGAIVIVKAGTKILCSATANSKGSFNIKIIAQKAGTILSVTATDKAGNTSKATKVKVGK